jgi:hypothetical protein
MKKLITVLFAGISLAAGAQTMAMNFTMNDCNNQMHNLYSELNQNNVAILEFFMMNCQSCIDAGNDIKPMHTALNNQFAGHVLLYDFGYTNSYTCTQVSNWVTTNGFNAVPFDSGAAQVAYYGGFGMPTIAVVAGSGHTVLFTNVGFATSDTGIIADSIRNYFALNPLSAQEIDPDFSFSVFPDPAKDFITVNIEMKGNSTVQFQVMDLSGKTILSDKISAAEKKKIYVSSLSNGMYLLKVASNGNSICRKIIVQR